MPPERSTPPHPCFGGVSRLERGGASFRSRLGGDLFVLLRRALFYLCLGAGACIPISAGYPAWSGEGASFLASRLARLVRMARSQVPLWFAAECLRGIGAESRSGEEALCGLSQEDAGRSGRGRSLFSQRSRCPYMEGINDFATAPFRVLFLLKCGSFSAILVA